MARCTASFSTTPSPCKKSVRSPKRRTKARHKPLVPVEMESVDALLLACQDGALATIAAERAAQSTGENMRAILLTAPGSTRRAGILWRKEASRSAAAREFAAMLHPAAAPDKHKKTARAQA